MATPDELVDVAPVVLCHPVDPCISITLRYSPPETPGRALGWHGTCTQCGHTMHRWRSLTAVRDAMRHVHGHEAVVVGGDPDSLVG